MATEDKRKAAIRLMSLIRDEVHRAVESQMRRIIQIYIQPRREEKLGGIEEPKFQLADVMPYTLEWETLQKVYERETVRVSGEVVKTHCPVCGAEWKKHHYVDYFIDEIHIQGIKAYIRERKTFLGKIKSMIYQFSSSPSPALATPKEMMSALLSLTRDNPDIVPYAVQLGLWYMPYEAIKKEVVEAEKQLLQAELHYDYWVSSFKDVYEKARKTVMMQRGFMVSIATILPNAYAIHNASAGMNEMKNTIEREAYSLFVSTMEGVAKKVYGVVRGEFELVEGKIQEHRVKAEEFLKNEQSISNLWKNVIFRQTTQQPIIPPVQVVPPSQQQQPQQQQQQQKEVKAVV